jgi:hypothetical protein
MITALEKSLQRMFFFIWRSSIFLTPETILAEPGGSRHPGEPRVPEEADEKKAPGILNPNNPGTN